MNINSNPQQRRLEEAQTEFLRAWAAAQNGGPTPQLSEIARRHPEVALELTEWAIEFVAREEALATQTEDKSEVSQLTHNAIERAKASLRAKPKNMGEAVRDFNLSQFKLAQKLRLAPSITSYLCVGELTDVTNDFPDLLADVLPIPASHIPTLLANSIPSASHFSAKGDPYAADSGTITLRQAIQYALEDEEISPEDAHYWFDKLNLEGK